MIQSVTITNYLGEKLEMELRKPAKSGFLIRSIRGLGPSKANVNTTEVSTIDGAIFNSARLNQRNIVLDLVFVETGVGRTRKTIEDIRQKSYKFFPIKKNLRLQIKTNNRFVETIGYVESNEPNIFSSQESATISIICPDPFLYSSGPAGTVRTVFYGIEPSFSFPFMNNSLTEPQLTFGLIQNKTENVIHYTGDAEVGILIQIHAIGEVTNITIYNVGTREKMFIDTDKLASLTGSGLTNGDDILINTRRGEKSITLVRGGKSTNILNCLQKNADWFLLSKGDNIFAFTTETGTTNLQFWIDNQILYEGV